MNRSRYMRFPSIFDRYLFREFWRYFLLALGGFVGFVLLFDMFEKIDDFIDYEASVGEVARYYMNVLPYQGVLVTPVALLLATFLSVGSMTRFHEITTMKSSGVSVYRLLMSVFLSAFFVAASAFVVSDWVMPDSQARAHEILEGDIKGRSTRNLGSRLNVNLIGRDGRYYLVSRYDIPRETMLDVVIQERDHDRVTRRIDAKRGIWQGDHWELQAGIDRRFSEQGTESAVPFESLVIDIPDGPEVFAKKPVRPEEMSYPDLRGYVERLRESGGRIEKYLTDLHLRVAFPLVNFVVVLIGAAMAVKMRRGGIALGFGFSLAIAFVYWSLIRAGQILGHNGTLPPLFAAWLGNIVFLTVGGWMLYRAPK